MNPGNLTADFIIPGLLQQVKMPLWRDFVTPRLFLWSVTRDGNRISSSEQGGQRCYEPGRLGVRERGKCRYIPMKSIRTTVSITRLRNSASLSSLSAWLCALWLVASVLLVEFRPNCCCDSGCPAQESAERRLERICGPRGCPTRHIRPANGESRASERLQQWTPEDMRRSSGHTRSSKVTVRRFKMLTPLRI